MIKEYVIPGVGIMKRGLYPCKFCGKEFVWTVNGVTGCPGCHTIEGDVSEEVYDQYVYYFRSLYATLIEIEKNTPKHSRRKAFGM